MKNCDACHDYSIGINWAPVMNLYQTGSYEMTCDEHYTGCDSDIKPTSSEPCDAGNMSIITACTYNEIVGVTNYFDNFCGCQSDINIVHLNPTCSTNEFHLHFDDDNSSELQLSNVRGIKIFCYKNIRHRKEIYQSNLWDCCTTVSALCE